VTKPLWVLEPCAGKLVLEALARTVLRGGRRSNPPDLPDSSCPMRAACGYAQRYTSFLYKRIELIKRANEKSISLRRLYARPFF